MICVSVPLAVTCVHRHDDAVSMVWVAEDVVTSFDAVELPAAPFQRAHRVARRDGR